MSTLRTQQISDDSIDSLGVSTITSLNGPVYRPSTLAGGVLVHCHRMNDGTILALYGRHWTDATTGTVSQNYTAYTEVEDPVWKAFEPTTGIPNFGQWSKSSTIPTDQTYTTRTLRAACSRRNYLYVLQRMDDKPYLQLLNLDRNVTQLGEEFVPILETETEEIWFDNGCYIDGSNLILIGEGQISHSVYLTRKSWARIGTTSVPWEYSTDSGWYPNEESTPEMSSEGALSTVGTGSGWVYKDSTYLSTVEDGVEKLGRFWMKKPGKRWVPVGSQIIEDSGIEYVDMGIRLQGHLVPNTNAASMNSSSNSYALPFIYSYRTTDPIDEVTDQYTLQNAWSLLPIQRKT